MAAASVEASAGSGAVLGVPVHAIEPDAAVQRILAWAGEATPRRVCFVNAHAAVTAGEDDDFAQALRASDLNLPDGAPVAWMLRRLGHRGQPRVSGPDLMPALLARCEAAQLDVYLMGSTNATLQRLQAALAGRWPRLRVAGAHAPPVVDGVPWPDEAQLAAMRDSGARVLFVGLGCPKQELWMARAAPRLPMVMLGVGAAFDFLAGTQARAPAWMRATGLEWLHRLAREPRRLAARYLRTNAIFMLRAARQLATHRRPPPGSPAPPPAPRG